MSRGENISPNKSRITEEKFNLYKNFVIDYIFNSYQKDNLCDALKSKNEIMLICDKYYAYGPLNYEYLNSLRYIFFDED